MIQSRYLLDILDLAFEEDNDTQSELIKQVKHLTEKERLHTGIGLYVYFENKSLPVTTKTDELFTGIIVKNESQEVDAEVMIYIVNGLINHIEIFNRTGTPYPTDDLQSYSINQSWMDKDKGRTIKR